MIGGLAGIHCDLGGIAPWTLQGENLLFDFGELWSSFSSSMRDEQHAMGTDEIVAMATRSLLQVVLIYRQGSALHRQPASPLICPFMHSLRTRNRSHQSVPRDDGWIAVAVFLSLTLSLLPKDLQAAIHRSHKYSSCTERQTDRQIGVSVQIN